VAWHEDRRNCPSGFGLQRFYTLQPRSSLRSHVSFWRVGLSTKAWREGTFEPSTVSGERESPRNVSGDSPMCITHACTCTRHVTTSEAGIRHGHTEWFLRALLGRVFVAFLFMCSCNVRIVVEAS
jgi:hypothetical protein